MTNLASSELFASLTEQERRDVEAKMVTVSLAKGQVLMSQGETADSMYMVSSGRLRATRLEDGRVVEIGDIGADEPVGEMALISDAPRAATITALRDCQLLSLEASAFQDLVALHPGMSRVIASVAVRRLESSLSESTVTPHVVVVVGLTGIDDATSVANELAAQARRARTVTSVEPVPNMLELERKHDLVIAIIGPDDTSSDCAEYTEVVMTAADSVVFVRDRSMLDQAQLPPVPDWITPETIIMRSGSRISGTANLLQQIGGGRHHHIERGVAADLARATRLILGTGTGLALSGGGMRGFAHVGVVHALDEAGVAIDAVSGTSAGAMVGSLVAQQLPADEIFSIMSDAIARNGFDPALPVVSLLGGAKAHRAAAALGRGIKVEDLPLSFTAVATNLTQDRAEHLTSGDLSWAVRASCSIPGLLPPMPHNGDALVDGGLADNLPLTPLRMRHPGITTIASDVSKSSILTGALLPASGKATPASQLRWALDRDGLPTIARLLSRITELDTGYGTGDPPDLLIRPKVDTVSGLGSADEPAVRQAGYRAAVSALDNWRTPTT